MKYKHYDSMIQTNHVAYDKPELSESASASMFKC